MPSSVIKQSEVDVLIIGAGPAGLMACNALAKSGIDVRIVDQRRVYLDRSRMCGLELTTKKQ
jgi:phenol 2-monooxygenase